MKSDRREYKRQYRLAHQAEIHVYNVKWYREHREERKQSKKLTDKDYYQRNKELIKNRSARWYAENKEKARASQKARYQRNKIKILKKQKEYAQRNKAKVRAYLRAYKKKHPHYDMASTHNRLSRIRATKEGKVTAKELKDLIARVKNCPYCGIVLTRANRHIDHIVPLAKGGLHTLSNLTPACKTCNQRKSHSVSWVQKHTENQPST